MKIEGYWLASGVLGVTASIMRRVVNHGADVVVTKSIGLTPRKGHAGPIITSSHGGLLNAVGLTNPGIIAFKEELATIKDFDIPVVLSIFGSTIEEIAKVAEHAIELNPQAIELNLSCPHAEISQIAHSPYLTSKYVEVVRDIVDCPLFVKLTPNASDIVSVGRAAQDAGADAIVAINTVRGMRIDIHQRRPVLGNGVGGFSGPPIFPIALRCVYDLYNALSIPIIGVGGVTSWEDAIEMHLAGASAIQIGTAVLSGLDVFSKIKSGVSKYLSTNGFKDVSEIVGLANPHPTRSDKPISDIADIAKSLLHCPQYASPHPHESSGPVQLASPLSMAYTKKHGAARDFQKALGFIIRPRDDTVGYFESLTGNFRSVQITTSVSENALDHTLYFEDVINDCSYQPGQFLMVWVPGVDEIPISMSSIRGKTIGITVRPVGLATNTLVGLSGGQWLGIRGPFGKSFDTIAKRPLIVGGGIGMAPLRPLVYRFLEQDVPVNMVIAAKTADELLFVNEMRSLRNPNLAVEVTTDDGTMGSKGFATVAVERILSEYSHDVIYTCGPEPMMAAIWKLAQKYGVSLQASLERYMKCGCGICGTCALHPTGVLVCKDGPVFTGEQLKTLTEFGKYHRDSTGVKIPVCIK